MEYIARTIKDRIATDDNQYQMTTMPNGLVKLTPNPTSVTEVGTVVNKGLLQPIEDGVTLLLNRSSMFGGFDDSTTVFSSDKIIVENDRFKKITIFNADGSITEEIRRIENDSLFYSKKTIFNPDGSIREEVL